MGNPRAFTTQFNARKAELEAFLKGKRCTSMTKRKLAFERAVSLPNRLPPIRGAAQ